MSDLSARLAQETYNMLGKKSKEDRIKKINENIKDTGYKAIHGKSNRDVVYFQNDDTKTIHIAHRGTDSSGKNHGKGKTGVDITADLMFAIGQEKHNKEFKKRRDTTSKLVKDIPDDYKLNMSGHSYGHGSMIDTIKNKKNVRDKLIKSGGLAEGYNGASSPFTKKASKATKEALKNSVVHHRTNSDLVSKASILNSDVGEVKTYKEKKSKKYHKAIPKHLQHVFNSLDQLNAHSLNNFIKNQ
jgi:hypothetical protein